MSLEKLCPIKKYTGVFKTVKSHGTYNDRRYYFTIIGPKTITDAGKKKTGTSDKIEITRAESVQKKKKLLYPDGIFVKPENGPEWIRTTDLVIISDAL